MKRLEFASLFTTMAVVAATVVLMIPGCEDSPSTNDAKAYADANPYASLPRETPLEAYLTVNPLMGSATLVGERLKFMVSGGAAPFSWSVTQTKAGSIEAQGDGRQAIYTVRTLDANDIIITDGSGQATLAKINGNSSSLQIIASDAAELPVDGERIVLTASGGEPKYTWRTVYPERGTIISKTRDTAVIQYRRDAAGDNVVILTDSRGDTASIVISQPDESSSGGGSSDLAITAEPTSLDTDGALSLITVTGGTAPYVFSQVNPLKGQVQYQEGGNTRIYKRYAAGDNAVQVTDADGETAYVIITQP